MPSPQPSEVAVPSVTREVLSTQGIFKGMGSALKRRKMQQKPKAPVQKKMYSEKEVKAGMTKSLESMRKERMKKGGPSSLSQWPATPKGLYKSKKK
jgi:hypothetical protein